MNCYSYLKAGFELTLYRQLCRQHIFIEAFHIFIKMWLWPRPKLMEVGNLRKMLGNKSIGIPVLLPDLWDFFSQFWILFFSTEQPHCRRGCIKSASPDMSHFCEILKTEIRPTRQSLPRSRSPLRPPVKLID